MTAMAQAPSRTAPVEPADLVTALRRELLRLAGLHDELAAAEAAKAPYWAPRPASVEAHEAAAQALRADADRLDCPAA